MVLHRSHGYYFAVEVKSVQLIGRRRFLPARSGLNGSYLMVWMALRLLCMPAQIIQTMAFTQIMDIWRPGRSLEDHLKGSIINHMGGVIRISQTNFYRNDIPDINLLSPSWHSVCTLSEKLSFGRTFRLPFKLNVMGM